MSEKKNTEKRTEAPRGVQQVTSKAAQKLNPKAVTRSGQRVIKPLRPVAHLNEV